MALYLADTSAWHRSGRDPTVREWWSDRLLRGELAVCSPVRLVLLYSARGRDDYESLRDDLAGLPQLPMDAAAARRAEDVQGLLAVRSQHRGPSPFDLYISAVAELNGATLLHYDRHFDAVGRVTGQSMQWLAPRGTLD